MKNLLQRVLSPIVAVSLLFAFSAFNANASGVTIDVAPNVLNIQSNSVVVTVHTDIAYSSVVGSSVYINGVAIDWWKADNQGNFVAKFDSDEVKTLDGLVIGDYNELVLSGYTTYSESFIGSQEILVIDNKPKGKN